MWSLNSIPHMFERRDAYFRTQSTLLNTKSAILYDGTPYILVDIHRRFSEILLCPFPGRGVALKLQMYRLSIASLQRRHHSHGNNVNTSHIHANVTIKS